MHKIYNPDSVPFIVKFISNSGKETILNIPPRGYALSEYSGAEINFRYPFLEVVEAKEEEVKPIQEALKKHLSNLESQAKSREKNLAQSAKADAKKVVVVKQRLLEEAKVVELEKDKAFKALVASEKLGKAKTSKKERKYYGKK